MAEYQHFDGEAYITMDIIAINEKKNKIEFAITGRGRISVTDLYKRDLFIIVYRTFNSVHIINERAVAF